MEAAGRAWGRLSTRARYGLLVGASIALLAVVLTVVLAGGSSPTYTPDVVGDKLDEAVLSTDPNWQKQMANGACDVIDDHEGAGTKFNCEKLYYAGTQVINANGKYYVVVDSSGCLTGTLEHSSGFLGLNRSLPSSVHACGVKP